jgi:hypothetical protein
LPGKTPEVADADSSTVAKQHTPWPITPHYRKFVSEFPVLEIESANESSRRRQVQFVQPLIINIEQKHASRMTAIQQDEGKPCPA